VDRTLFTLLLGLALLAGCSRSDTRSPDPLDWRIGADDAFELQEWFDTNIPLMPEELAQEVTLCLSNLRASNYAGPNAEPLAKANKLAHRLDGRTIREVLIQGNEATVRLVESQLQREADELMRMINTTDGTDARAQKYIDRQRTIIDALKKRLAQAQDHLTELHASGLK